MEIMKLSAKREGCFIGVPLLTRVAVLVGAEIAALEKVM
jgi:hypothetical protein